MLNKRASTLTIEEVIRLIVVAAGIFLIIILVGSLLYPFIFGKDEALNSYFETFEKEMQKVDNGEIGEFEIWQEDKAGEIYLVYFNEENVYTWEGRRFFIDNSSLVKGESYENYICMCRPYEPEEVEECNKEFCTSLKKEVLFLDKDGNIADDTWSVGFNQLIRVTIVEDGYLFVEPNKDNL